MLRTDSLKKAPNATGVSLEFPLEVQLFWLQTLLPGANTVGVIYHAEENQKRIELNIDVIAEGVETVNQLDQIRNLQCNFGQGYLFSKPVSRRHARAMIGNKPEFREA